MTIDRHPSSDEPDDVATLIRLAGPRPAVPDERIARVRAVVEAHWWREVRRRGRVRTLWAGAALAAAASIVLAITVLVVRRDGDTGPAASPVLRVESSIGSVSVRGGGAPGSEIVTGEGGRIAVRLVSGQSVRLDEGGRIRVIEAGTLALDRGAAYVDSGAGGASVASLTLRTPLGSVQETGTQFEVRVSEDAIRIRVREGSVVLRDAGPDVPIPAGAELERNADGSTTMREIARHGPEWAWVADVAPMPDIEGLSARAFLDWAAREGGWTLTFGEEDIARSASRTVLHGSVRGLRLEEALEAVLPTCRMTHRVEDGRLLVEALRGDGLAR